MKATIHQLYFFPWLGYFSKIYHSDIFVVFDSADFRKRHYYDRVKIIDTNGYPNFISLPTGQNYKVPCKDVIIKDANKSIRNKILRTLQESYSKANYYDSEWDKVKLLVSNSLFSSNFLVDINYNFIINTLEYLGITDKQIILTSQLQLNYSNANEMIIQVCKSLNIDSLILGDGKSTEIHNLDLLKKNGIKVLMQEYIAKHPEYIQSRRKKAGFVKGLSILDCLLNVGKEKTLEYITDSACKPEKLNINTIT